MINKLADYQDLNTIPIKTIVRNLLMTKHKIDALRVPYSDHMQDHWLRLWEYSRAILYSGLDSRMTVLDAGGSGTIFSIYMALEGCQVYTLDINETIVNNAQRICSLLGLGNINNTVQNIVDLQFDDNFFDIVYCICVIEHNTIEAQKTCSKQLARVLKPGGILAITFDYGKDAADNPMLSYSDIVERIIIPSDLVIYGNTNYDLESKDMRKQSLDYTFGSLFLKKPGNLQFDNTQEIDFSTKLLDRNSELYHYSQR